MMPHAHENPLEPSSFLVKNVNILPKGRVFDVAMGSGRNAVYLAKRGFIVEGVDISGEAIKEALELAKQEGVKISVLVLELIPADFHFILETNGILIGHDKTYAEDLAQSSLSISMSE